MVNAWARFGRRALPLTTLLAAGLANAQQRVMPEHVLVGYWQNFTNAAPVMKLGDTSPAFNVVEVSFATPDAENAGGFKFDLGADLVATIPGGYTITEFDADVKRLKAQGRFVLLAVGGQHRSFALTSDAMAENFAESAAREMKAHGFDGIDIDLENVITSANVQFLEKALRRLREMIGPSLMLTLAPQPSDMSPQTPERAQYLNLVKNLGPIVTMVNTQYYNSGTKRGRDGKIYVDGTVDFITAQADDVLRFVPAERVGIGLTANPATRGYLKPEVAAAALRCLTKLESCGTYVPQHAYPKLRGAMMWSANGDAAERARLSTALKDEMIRK